MSTSWVLLGSAVLAIGVLALLYWLSKLHSLEREWLEKIRPEAERDTQVNAFLTGKWLSDRVAAHEDRLRNITSFVGSLGIILGILFTWYQFRSTIRATTEQIRYGRQGIVAEQIRTGIAGLGATEESVRLGNLLLLERVSRDEAQMYAGIVDEIIAAFVRRRATLIAGSEARGRGELWPPLDVRGAIAILGRRTGVRSGLKPDQLPDLRGVYLVGADLSGVALRGLRLEDAQLSESHLDECDLSYTLMSRAHMEESSLYNSTIIESSFENALLMDARLSLAHAERALFRGAQLQNARLLETHMELANLRGANLGSVDMLTQPQLETADGDGSTILPPSLRRPSIWSR